MKFLEKNRDQDGWFLQIEAFDPHEPFFSPEKYKRLYPHEIRGKHFDWPGYGRVSETPEEVKHCRLEYAALLSMCDEYLGKLLDAMDEHDLWKDTMLIVTADHGFLLGEHEWWAKNVMPFYNEIARIPMFAWDPRSGARGERRSGLVQLADLAPTLLEYFGVDIPDRMLGMPLRDAIASDAPVHESVLFGLHGAHVNVTDGRYVYMRAPDRPDNAPHYEYTLMPCHMADMFSVEELQEIRLAEPFPFTRGVRTIRTPARSYVQAHRFGTLLFDLDADPGQERPLADPDAEQRMRAILTAMMRKHDAPAEQYEQLGLD